MNNDAFNSVDDNKKRCVTYMKYENKRIVDNGKKNMQI